MNKSYITYPNQKEIIVHKPSYTGNYMSVGNDEWIEASKKLTFCAFKLYLYMASNCDKYMFALSKKAVQNSIGMSDNSYSKAVKELTNNHYLVLNNNNLYDFYTVPQVNIPLSDGISHSNGEIYPALMEENTPLQDGDVPNSNGGEISKQLKKNNLSKDADAKKLRELEDLSDEELMELDRLFKLNDRENYDYLTLKKMFSLKCSLDKKLSKEIEAIFAQRTKDERSAEIKAQVSAMSDSDIVRISNYLNCEFDEVSDNLSYIGVTADYFLEWLDDKHAETFAIDGSVWKEETPNYKTYIDFVKMGIDNNPVGMVHNFFGW